MELLLIPTILTVVLLLVLWVITLVALVYIDKRNDAVCAFRHRMIDVLYKEQPHLTLDRARELYDGMPSYEKMLYSFKRLEIETYFTPEEIKEILNQD